MRTRPTLMLFALLAITAATVSAQQWELIDSPHSPSPRAGHTMTFVGDTLYLFGGFSGAGQALNDLWRWDDSAEDWIEMHPTNPPSPRYGHAAVAAGGRLWVILGQDGTPTGSIWVYDPATNAWHDDTPPGAELVSRIQHAATAIAHTDGSETIYFTGGLSFFFEALTEAWAIDVTGSKLVDLRRLSDLPVGLYGHALAPSKPQTPGALDRIANSYGRTIESVSDRLIYLELADVPSEWIDQPGDALTFNRVASAPTLDGRTLVVGDRPTDDGPENEILIQTFRHRLDDVEIDIQKISAIPVARFESSCAAAVDGIGSRYFTVGGGRTLDGTYFDDYWQGPDGGLPFRYPRYIPAANGAGVGVEWTTIWSGINGSDNNCDFDVTLFDCPRKLGATCSQQLIVPPGGLFWFDDVLDDLFGASGTFALEIDAVSECLDNLKFISRISSSDGTPGAPTQGQGFPLLGENEIATPSNPMTILELHGCDAFRTNIGLIGACDVPTEVRISLFDADTLALLGDITVTVQPDELVQINRVFERAGITCAVNAVALVEVLNEGGCAATYSSVIDNNGQDPTTQLPTRPEFDFFIPVAAHVRGSGGLDWATWAELQGSDTARVTTTFYFPLDGTVHVVVREFDFSDREIRRTDNVVGDWFGVDQATGWVRVQADHAVSATSRTFSTSGGGPGAPTYGQGIPAVPMSDAFGSAARPLAAIPGLERSADPTMGFRSNLILINLGAADITLEATLYDGGLLLGTTTYTLRGFGLQIVTDVFRTVTDMDVTRGSVFVRSTTPGGRFFAAGSMVDNQRGDGTWVPGQ